MIQYKMRQYAFCADTYRKLMSISPLSPEFHRSFAICNYKLDKISIAREELIISWQLEKNSEIEFLFAVLMLKESRPEITFEILDRISISGNEPLKSLALGAASVWLGNKTLALRAYDKLRQAKSRFAELLLPMIY